MSLSLLLVLGAQHNSEVGGDWVVSAHYPPELSSPRMISESRATVELGDLDHDGVLDFAFVAVGGNGTSPGLFALSGASGDELWRFNYLLELGLGRGPTSLLSRIDDIDGDGTRDLVTGDPWILTDVGQRYSGIVSVHSGETGELIWMVDDDLLGDRLGQFASGVGDQNGDGFPDIAVTTGDSPLGLWQSALHILSGVDGSLVSTISATTSWPFFGGLAERDSLVDVDGDGRLDVLVQVDTDQIDAYSIATGQVVASYPGSDIVIASGNTVSLSVPDRTGDGIPDLITPVDSFGANEIHLVDRVTGQEIWRRNLPGTYVSTLESGNDWDGDGILDLVVGLPDRQVSGFPQQFGVVDLRRGSNGKLIRRIEVGVLGLPKEDFFGVGVVFDQVTEQLFVREGNPLNPGESPPLIRLEFSRFLYGDTSSVSASNGGQVVFDLDFPSSLAGKLYSIGVSASGVGPTEFKGLEIPLGLDNWLRASYTNALPPVFAFRTGQLDSSGDAVAYLGFPPNVLLPAVGSEFWIAAIAADSRAAPIVSSAAWRIEVLP